MHGNAKGKAGENTLSLRSEFTLRLDIGLPCTSYPGLLGLKFNKDKKEALGSSYNNCQPLDNSIVNKPIKILGFNFTYD